MDYTQKLYAYLERINEKLHFYIDSIEEKSIVSEAMEYSLMNAGKRVRPVMALAFCEMLGGDIERVLPYACAVEMIHTYSLIHDDLPCMDDDDLRRGKPSCHKQFGEAYALLAGDALLNLAAEVVCGRFDDLEPHIALGCGKILFTGTGIDGMIGGQTLDLASENTQLSLETLKKMQALKTGKLLTVPCQIGVLAAGGSEADMQTALEFGTAIGLQFQIVDDILDVTSTEETLGKPIGSDVANEKSTYVSLLGLDKAEQTALEMQKQALALLKPYGEKAWFLNEQVNALSTRNK